MQIANTVLASRLYYEVLNLDNSSCIAWTTFGDSASCRTWPITLFGWFWSGGFQNAPYVFVLLKCTTQGGPKVDVLLIAFLYLWLKFWDGIDKYWIVPVRKLFYFHHW